MTSVAVRPTESEAFTVVDPMSEAVEQFASTLHLAAALVKSGFLPKAINTPEKAVAVMLAGKEMGIGPMLALRSINIIDGKPVVSADLQLARFKANGGRAMFTHLDAMHATLHLKHPNGDEHTESFTMEDAKAAGLTTKQNWRQFPKAMLRSRVITAGLKSIGYEPTCGIYDPDEADHFAPAPRPTLPDAQPTATVTEEPATTGGEGADVPHDLAWARALPLAGKSDKWNNNGGKPIGDVPGKILAAAKDWMTGKLGDTGDERLAEQIEAIALVLAAEGEVPEATPEKPSLMEAFAREAANAEARKRGETVPEERAQDGLPFD